MHQSFKVSAQCLFMGNYARNFLFNFKKATNNDGDDKWNKKLTVKAIARYMEGGKSSTKNIFLCHVETIPRM